jgi:hypothetical protein
VLRYGCCVKGNEQGKVRTNGDGCPVPKSGTGRYKFQANRNNKDNGNDKGDGNDEGADG